IGRIYCSGTPPEGLLSTLSTEFNGDATPWDPLKTPAIRNGRVGMNGNQNTAAVALGLSLRALKGSFSGVDFRKTVFPVKKFFHGVSGNLKTSLSLAGCTLLLFTLSLFFQERVYQKRLQQLRIEGRGIFKKAVPEVKRVVNEIAQLKEKIAKIRLENIILGTVEGHKESPILFLREITLNYPKEDSGEIYRYTFGKEDIRIEGTSPSLRTVDEIKKSLAKIKGVKKIQVTNTKLAADKESVDFKLILLLSGVKK
ncbi:MAG: hypothetical protein ACE5FU_14150, partial [Nitrospinota bacterium]